MPEWSGSPLRRGSRGPAVVWLQTKLAAWGYSPGPCDGRFGLLTEEAVYRLQADYRLRQDGVAGRQVAHLLKTGAPALHTSHTVVAGEDLYALAERYGVSPALLRRLAGDGGGRSRARDLSPGVSLSIPVRPVLAVVEETAPGAWEGLRRALIRHRRQVTALVAPWLTVTPGGGVQGKPDRSLWETAKELRLPLVARTEVSSPDGLVPTGGKRRRAVEEIAFTAMRYQLPGIYLSFAGVRGGERLAAAALVTALRRTLPADVRLLLELSPEAAGIQAPAGPADCLVLRLPAAAGVASPADRRSLVRTAVRRHPSYRVLLGLSAADTRGALASGLDLVTRLALAGVALWDLTDGQEAVFRAMADLFSVQGSEAWLGGRRNIHRPGA